MSFCWQRHDEAVLTVTWMWPTEATSQQHSCLCMWWQFELGSVSTADTCQTVRKGKKTNLFLWWSFTFPKHDNCPAEGADHKGIQNVTARSAAFCSACSPSACPGKTKVKNETQPWVLIMYGARPVSFCPVSYSLGPRHLAICQPWPTGGRNAAARQRLQKGGGRKRQGCRNRRRERSEERKEMRQKKG